jgi:hypothetical protein
MAGTPRGCVEIHTPSGTATASQHAQVLFKNIYDVMVSHPTAEIVSLYYGQTGGSGTDYFDGANPFTNGAFFVVKMPANVNRDFDYYWLCQYKSTLSAITGNGLPALFWNATNINCVGFAVACVSGSSENPWNGGLVASGSDAKGTPVWVATTGSVLVMPASNYVGGTHATNKENMGRIGTSPTDPAARTSHFVCDDDNVVCLSANVNNFSYVTYFGPYAKCAAASGSNNMVFYSTDASTVFSIGTTAEPLRSGVISAINGQNFVDPFINDTASYLRNSTFVPTSGSFGFLHAEVGIDSYSSDATTYVRNGLAGTYGPDFVSMVFNCNNRDVKSDYSRAYFGDNASMATTKIGIPWDGFTVPGTGLARTGSVF